jgi:hypothetical protein
MCENADQQQCRIAFCWCVLADSIPKPDRASHPIPRLKKRRAEIKPIWRVATFWCPPKAAAVQVAECRYCEIVIGRGKCSPLHAR